MKIINNMWLIYLEGKFGYFVQREIWLGLGKNWDKFLLKIGWKNGNIWSRYFNEFIWNLSVLKGYLFFFNLFCGV